LHLPAGSNLEFPLPLVVALHGGPGSGDGLRENTGLIEKADAEGFAVAFAEGQEFKPGFQSWNTGYCCGITSRVKIDDVGFIRSLIQFLVQSNAADASRVFVIGFSKGAIMAQRFACEAADVVTGIADISGALDFDTCAPAKPVHVFISHGKADRNVIYGETEARARKLTAANNWPDRPVEYSVDFWAKKNQCIREKSVVEGVAEVHRFNCKGAGLRLVSFENEGHTWPGARAGIEGADKPTQQFSVTDAMWDFFRELTKPK